MPKKAKQYSAPFRANAVRLASESERPITEVAKDLGVEYATLYGWMKKAGKTKQIHDRRVVPLRPAEPPETAEDEVRRLRRELEEVRMERDFLKKATAYSTGQRNTTTSDSWLKEVVTNAGAQTRLGLKRTS